MSIERENATKPNLESITRHFVSNATVWREIATGALSTGSGRLKSSIIWSVDEKKSWANVATYLADSRREAYFDLHGPVFVNITISP